MSYPYVKDPNWVEVKQSGLGFQYFDKTDLGAVGGGGEQISVTKASLATLVSGSDLVIGNVYVLTDSTSLPVASTIYLTALDDNKLSRHASFSSSASHTPTALFPCVYDHVSDVMESFFDYVNNNQVIGTSSISSYPYGSVNITSSIIRDTNIIGSTLGTITQCFFDRCQSITLTGSTGAVLQRSTFGSDVVLTLTNSTNVEFTESLVDLESTITLTSANGTAFRQSVVSDRCLLSLSSHGSSVFLGSSFRNRSFVNGGASGTINIDHSSFSNISTLNISGATGGAGRSVNRVFVDSSSTLTLTGAQNARAQFVSISNATTVNCTDSTGVSLSESDFVGGETIDLSDSTNSSISNSKVDSGAQISGVSGTLTVQSSTFSENSILVADGCDDVSVNTSTFKNESQVDVTGSTGVINQCFYGAGCDIIYTHSGSQTKCFYFNHTATISTNLTGDTNV